MAGPRLRGGVPPHQANPLLHQIGIGESLWAFTRRSDGRYALAAELVISAKTMNPRGFRYGPYRVWGDLQRSRYFRVEAQPDVSTLIRWLTVGRVCWAVLFRGRRPSAPWKRRTICDCDFARLDDWQRGRWCKRPLLRASGQSTSASLSWRYLFIAFITAPTIAVRIAPPPAPSSALPRRPPSAPPAAGSAPAAPPRRLLRSVPPATPPTAPLMILVNWLIATCCKTAPTA
jgi:hypothetical protein